MSRRKPRFTPDPPPYNATGDQILAWVNAQLLRIEDYWPRDDGDRISALEELQSKYSGEWSISGQSLIRFEGSTSKDPFAWNCDSFTYDSGTTTTSSIQLDVGFAFSGGDLYAALTAQGIYKIDTTALTITRFVTPTGAANDFMSVLPHSEGNQLAVTYSIVDGLGADQVVQNYSLPSLTAGSAINIGNAPIQSMEFASESADILSGIGANNGRAFFFDKANLSSRTVSAFATTSWMWIGTSDFANNEFLAAYLDATGRVLEIRKFVLTVGPPLAFTTENASVASIDLDDYETSASWDMGHKGLAYRSGYYWMPIEKTALGSEEAGFLLFDEEGTVLETRWIVAGSSWSQIDNNTTTRTYGTQWPYYDSASDCFYWGEANTICRYNPTSEETSCCTVEETADWTGTASLLHTVIVDGDYLYAWDYNATDQGSAPYTSAILKVQIYGN